MPSKYGLSKSFDVPLLPYSLSGEISSASTGQHTLQNTQYLKVLIANPSNSGKDVIFVLRKFYADALAFVTTILNPNTNLPTTIHTIETINFDIAYTVLATMNSYN